MTCTQEQVGRKDLEVTSQKLTGGSGSPREKFLCIVTLAFGSFLLLAAGDSHGNPGEPGVLVLDVNPSCTKGAKIIARHPACWNATPEPWFPATVASVEEADGELQVIYGYDENEGWTNASGVIGTKALYYPCRDEDWEQGDVGRGFQYLPDCGDKGGNSSQCALGCRVVPPTGCVQGEFIEFGEVCTARCATNYTPSRVNITCDLDQPVRLRTFQCREGNPDLTTLTTTLFVDLDLKGCSELQQLREGVLSTDPNADPLPVGMPGLALNSGGIYFEVEFEGPHEQVGWVDAAWMREPNPAFQWMSPYVRTGDVVGAAVRVLEDGIADMWFSKNGIWERKQGKIIPSYTAVVYEPPLIPVAMLRARAHFILPEIAWYRGPPPGGFIPFTSRPYPHSCLYPPTYMLFANPARCGDGFEQLNNTKECQEAAFTLGLADNTPLLGEWGGWPGGCFRCTECDLSGNLYLNTDPTQGNNTVDMMRTPPNAAAVCRRFDPRSTTTTTTTFQRVFVSTTLMPPKYTRMNKRCSKGYQPILDRDECEDAAVWLDLYDVTAQIVELGNEDVDEDTAEAQHWPAGCFYCLACDNGQLYFNLDNSSLELNAIASDTATTPQTTTAPPAGTYVTEPMCRAPAHILTTLPQKPVEDTTTQDFIISTTEEQRAETTSVTDNIYFVASTTTLASDNLGMLTCLDPYDRIEEIPWWKRLEVMVGGGALVFCCCCCPLVLWFFGVCDACCDKLKKRCCRCCVCCRCCRKKKKEVQKEQMSEDDKAALEAEKELEKILGAAHGGEDSGNPRASRRKSMRNSQAGGLAGRRASRMSKTKSENRKSMTPAVAALDAALDEEGNWSEPDDEGPGHMHLDPFDGRESVAKRSSLKSTMSVAEAFGKPS